jgi:hypothetical protein
MTSNDQKYSGRNRNYKFYALFPACLQQDNVLPVLNAVDRLLSLAPSCSPPNHFSQLLPTFLFAVLSSRRMKNAVTVAELRPQHAVYYHNCDIQQNGSMTQAQTSCKEIAYVASRAYKMTTLRFICAHGSL